MIANRERTVAISSVGWVDGDALWRFDHRTGAAERLSLGSGAQYVSLHCSGTDHFAVAHHFDGTRLELTVHGFEDPTTILGRASIDATGSRIVGDPGVWTHVPRVYAAYLSLQPWNDFVLLTADLPRSRLAVHPLAWYDGTYDKGYQAITGVLERPATRQPSCRCSGARSWCCTICRRERSGVPSASPGGAATRRSS